MADYAKMYRLLSNSQTDAIRLLQKAQQEAEEIYISAEDPKLKLFPGAEGKTDKNDDE